MFQLVLTLGLSWILSIEAYPYAYSRPGNKILKIHFYQISSNFKYFQIIDLPTPSCPPTSTRPITTIKLQYTLHQTTTTSTTTREALEAIHPPHLPMGVTTINNNTRDLPILPTLPTHLPTLILPIKQHLPTNLLGIRLLSLLNRITKPTTHINNNLSLTPSSMILESQAHHLLIPLLLPLQV